MANLIRTGLTMTWSVLLAASASAGADTLHGSVGAPSESGWHAAPSILLGFEHLDYEESVPAITGGGDMVVDKNTGLLPTMELGVEATSPRSYLFGRASLRMTGGSGTYDGATQTGTPVSGSTAGHMIDVEGIAGARGHVGRFMFGGFAGLGHHSWDRDLTPLGVAGYREDYSWTYVVVGTRIDVAATERLAFALEGSVTAPRLLGTSSLAISRSTLFDDIQLELGPDFGFRSRLSATYALTRGILITAVASIDSFVIDGSSSATVTQHGVPETDGAGNQLKMAEPRSTTVRTGMSVGAAYLF